MGPLHVLLLARWSPKLGTISNYQTVSPHTRVNKGQKEEEAAYADLGSRSVLPERSRLQLFHLFQEVHVRLIGDSCPLHRFPQVGGVGEPPGVLQAALKVIHHDDLSLLDCPYLRVGRGALVRLWPRVRPQVLLR
jgi:hypothetical protein